MIFKLILILMLAGVVAVFLPRLITSLHAATRIYSVAQAPAKPVAVVFGAGLWRDGSPTPVLRDRVATAAELYFQGKVTKLLMSGDNRFANYNEPGAMRTYAIDIGVPAEDIVLDYAGRRTYDTCLRAKEIFGASDVILVTQQFHLPRALFVCNQLGVTAVGVAADQVLYRPRSLLWWHFRELPATMVAFWELFVSNPQVVLGEPEPILPNKSQLP